MQHPIDDILIQFGSHHLKADVYGGSIHVEIHGNVCPPTLGHGAFFESAIRDALENARLGWFAETQVNAGDRLYACWIEQDSAQNGFVVERKTFVATDDAHAYVLALLAFSDRPGFRNVDVALLDVIKGVVA